MANGMGRPPLDWDTIIPQILDQIAQGLPAVRAVRKIGLEPGGDVWRHLTSEEWASEYARARKAGALARVDLSQDRLMTLAEAEPGTIKREQIDAARWESEHAKWMAERSDSESWGREDRLKVASVSAIRVIVETPPVAAQLPPLEYVAELPVTQHPPQLGAGGGE